MPDNFSISQGLGIIIRAILKGNNHHQVVVIDLGGSGAENLLTGSMPVTGPVTDTQIRATALPVSLSTVPSHVVTGTFWQATQPTSDAGPAWTSKHGLGSPTVPFYSTDQHSSLASCTDAPTNGQKLVITDLLISVDTTMAVTFKEETSETVIAGPFYMSANSTVQFTCRSKMWKLLTADKKLQVITSVTGNIMVDAGYYSEA